MKTKFKLQFHPSKIKPLADKYEYSNEEKVMGYKKQIQARGYLSRQEFLDVCAWKTPRSKPRCAENNAQDIKDITRIALGTKNEKIRIEILTLLRGVRWPTASVILHFYHKGKYPILDFRALESLGVDVPNQYDFKLWQAYTSFCREQAMKYKVDMRTLDRALWQYSKDKSF